MASSLNPAVIWRGWTAPTVTGDLAQRRESVLLNTLATLIIVGLMAEVIQWSPVLFGQPIDNPLIWLFGPALALTVVAFYALLRAARAGHHRASATCLVVLFVVLTLLMVTTDGLQAPTWPMLSALTVVLAAMLLGGRAATIATAVLAIAVAVIAGAVIAGLIEGPDPNAPGMKTDPFGAVAVTLLVGLIARVGWLYTRDVLTGIDDVLTGGSPDSPLRQLRTKDLTVREIEVIQLVAEGHSNDAIAKRLFVSPRTVQSHVANAMRKSACSNRTELGVLAIREGLVPLEPTT